MTGSTKPAKSWRQLAAKVAQEDDPQKLSELSDEPRRAMVGDLGGIPSVHQTHRSSDNP